MMILRYSYELEWLIWGVIYDNNMSDICAHYLGWYWLYYNNC
jgi:hypothetical protein